MPQGFELSDATQWDISIHGTDLAATRQVVDDLWKRFGPGLPYMVQSADELRATVYEQEQQMTTMLTAVAFLAVGVAMLGAYALVSDSLRRRRTELVLHRLHGAWNASIVKVVMSEFTVPLSIGLTVGLSLGAWLGWRYLSGFVDRVAVGGGIVGPMVAACMAIVAVVAVAALRHVRQALTIQPVEALK
jgi:predicted lysophospholipase L1 biosynthesis ABC-type transport system permease subunit